MKKNYLLIAIATSFGLGFLTRPFDQNWAAALILTSSLVLLISRLRLQRLKSNPMKIKFDPRVQYWDNIYFYLLSLNFSINEKELRVWGANIQSVQDFESYVRLVEQVALKAGAHLKMIVTDHDSERLEKLTASPLAKKVRFANVNLSDPEWPFKYKFDIVYADKIKNIDVAKKSFHARLEKCLYNNSALIVNPNMQEFFFRRSWSQSGHGVLTKNYDATSSHGAVSDLGNEIRSNFL